MGDVDKPFFSVDLTPTWLLGSASIPYSTSYTPMNLALLQPPLPQSPQWKENGQIGTDHWWNLAPLMKVKSCFFHSLGSLNDWKYGDDFGFPDVKPWNTGMWLADFALEFYIGEDPTTKNKKE